MTGAVEATAYKKILDKSFWRKEDCIGPLRFDYPIFSISKEMEKLGGVLKIKNISSDWYPPKGSRLYNLVWGENGNQLYYLLCLKDGGEVILKQTFCRIAIVDRISPFASRRLMLEFFKEFHGSEKATERAIRKLFKTKLSKA
ncbi:MAG: hypothetical protein AAB577_00570 [Patescibacteria group bacterium]